MFKTPAEYITEVNSLELWGVKYTFTTWVALAPTVDERTGHLYNPGDLCFALLSYIDEKGSYHLVDETKYFKQR